MPVVFLLVATLTGTGVTLLLAISNDEVVAPDAVVLLGGGSGERLELGRTLAEEHDVPLVLSEGAIVEGRRDGLTCREQILCETPDPGPHAERRGWSQHWPRRTVGIGSRLVSPASLRTPNRLWSIARRRSVSTNAPCAAAVVSPAPLAPAQLPGSTGHPPHRWCRYRPRRPP